jgi:hypothetical protein
MDATLKPHGMYLDSSIIIPHIYVFHDHWYLDIANNMAIKIKLLFLFLCIQGQIKLLVNFHN